MVNVQNRGESWVGKMVADGEGRPLETRSVACPVHGERLVPVGRVAKVRLDVPVFPGVNHHASVPTQDRPYKVWGCPVPGCEWALSPGVAWVLSVEGLPTCKRGHPGAWRRSRRVAARYYYECHYLFDPSGPLRCGERGSVGEHGGFLRPGYSYGANLNLSKGAVAAALHILGVATITQLVAVTGLSRAQVTSVCRRSNAARFPYMVKSEERQPTAIATAYVYRLSPRGELWLRWALEHGFVPEALASRIKR